ncbi:MAG: EAL domain-containing protein, partial [Pseudomonadota bacterium]
RAKQAGADRIDIFKASMRGSDQARLPLESDLRRAIERKQIKVLYQPITNLEANTLAGFEALVRWDHPKQGRLNPDDFVSIAEETGLIAELGGYVLDQAVKQLSRWQKSMPITESRIFVSVNVSSSQLFRQDLLQQIRSVLSRDAVPKETLRLEVTESLVMENPEQAIEILNVLKELGAGLSLDDFGTGFSSLSYLQRFPFDTIKVDKSFIRDAAREGTSPVILRSVVAMSHELGKKIVAEGVESSEDADYLRSIGCEYAQGFYFGEPMTDKAAARLVTALSKALKKQSASAARTVRKAAPAKAPARALPKPATPAAPPAKPAASPPAKPAGKRPVSPGTPVPAGGATPR